jgi:hypothetical protein
LPRHSFGEGFAQWEADNSDAGCTEGGTKSGRNAICGPIAWCEPQVGSGSTLVGCNACRARDEYTGKTALAVAWQDRRCQIHGRGSIGRACLRQADDTARARIHGTEQDISAGVEIANIGGDCRIAEAAVKAAVARRHVETQQVLLDEGQVFVAQPAQMHSVSASQISYAFIT